MNSKRRNGARQPAGHVRLFERVRHTLIGLAAAGLVLLTLPAAGFLAAQEQAHVSRIGLAARESLGLPSAGALPVSAAKLPGRQTTPALTSTSTGRPSHGPAKPFTHSVANSVTYRRTHTNIIAVSHAKFVAISRINSSTSCWVMGSVGSLLGTSGYSSI